MTDPDPLDDLLGSSPALAEVKSRARQMLAGAKGGRRLPPVLIQGETGTGKGLLARALHHASPRTAGPFVAVNCGAIPETLAESEFFGFARGAHSEARRAKVGLFQAADRGTIFLDEVGLLSESHQARLLKVVEDRQVVPVGSTSPLPVDLWLISATNADLSADIQNHRFRRDLYERLAVMTFTLPPLRERPGDIVPLAERFLARSCAEYGLRPKTLAPDAQSRLVEHLWPGNVRELANVIERVALLVEADTIPAARLELASPALVAEPLPASPLSTARRDSRERILEALERQEGNITRTAVVLGVTRKTLREWMKQKGLYPYPDSRDLPASAQGSEREVHVWERRHVAYLLVTFTEEAASRRPLRTLAAKADVFGGRVEEWTSDGFLVEFGAEPMENAPMAAAFAALAMSTAAQRERDEREAAGEIRIALHAVHNMIAAGGSSHLLGFEGKTAAWTELNALVQRAPANTIVVSASAAPFIDRRFQLTRLMTDGPRAYRLMKRYDAAAGFTLTEFVGRESALEALTRVLGPGRHSRGTVVAIVGDPGVGKSRLMHELMQSLGGWRMLRCGAVPYGRSMSYLPIVDLLRSACAIDDDDTAVSVHAKVTAALSTLEDRVTDISTPLLDLLHVLPSGHPFLTTDPPERRRRTLEAFKQFVIALAGPQPLCLAVEDLQWLDTESQACLDVLVEALAAAPIALVVNYRPEYRHAWSHKSYYTQLRLNPLDPADAHRLLLSLLGDDSSLTSLTGLLIERSEGNPFFLEENVKRLVDSDALAGDPGRYRLVRAVTAIEVPTTVQAVLEARIDRLSADAKRVMHAAAVIGTEVPVVLLEAIAGFASDRLGAVLTELQAAELLYEHRRGAAVEYLFKHALTHEVAYATVREADRRNLHGRIVDAIETLHTGRLTEHVERLAHHALRGHVWTKAIVYLRQAAGRAFARSANREAAEFLEEALAVLEHLPGSRGHLAEAIDIRLDLRNALQLLGNLDQVRRYVVDAEPLVRALNDPRRLGWWSAYVGHYRWITGAANEADGFIARAAVLADEVGDESLQIVANLYYGLACMVAGDHARADRALRKVIGILGPERMYERFGQVGYPAVMARAYLVYSLAERGEFAEGVTLGLEGMRLASVLEHPYTIGLMGANVAWLYAARGDVEDALALIERADAVSREGAFILSSPRTTWYVAHVHLRAGRVAQALPQLEAVVASFESVGMRVFQSRVAVDLGEAYLAVHQFDEARAAAERAIALAGERDQQGHLAYGLRLMGAIAAESARAEDAEDFLGQALMLARRLGLGPLEARCLLDLGAVYHRMGKTVEAATHREAGQGLCREMRLREWGGRRLD